MTKEDLFRAVGEVREDHIMEAETAGNRRRPWRRYGALAACLAVVLAAAFALERLEDARKWAALKEGFDVLSTPESIPDSGGTGNLDGAEYWSDGEKRPASSYSVNVEIGEVSNPTAADKAANRTEALDRESVAFSPAASMDVAWLSPEEIFAKDTAIFRGTVQDMRYYVVAADGSEIQYTAASVKVTDPIRGALAAGEVCTVLYMGGPGMSTSLSGPLAGLEAGSDAIFMPIVTTPETGWRDGGSFFCYADLGELYISEGMRYVFLDTGDGLAFERSAYAEIADAETLDEVADYIRKMTVETFQPAVNPAEPVPEPITPQSAPAYTAQANDPARGPSGALEMPGGAVIGEIPAP